MNPIDQRNANRKATGCPVFWRNVGTPFAWFLALYPWGVFGIGVAILPIIDAVSGLKAIGIPASGVFQLQNFLGTLVRCLGAFGFLLLPAALVWCVVMRTAVDSGLAPKLDWWCCVVVGGGFLVLAAPVLTPMVLAMVVFGVVLRWIFYLLWPRL